MTKPEEIKSKPRGRLKLRGFRSKLGEQFSIFRCEASLLVGLSVHVCMCVVTVVNLNILIFYNYRVC